MIFICQALVSAILISVLAFTTRVSAQSETMTASVQSASGFLTITQRALPLNLIAGPVRGQLTASSLEGSYSSGASVFVQFTLSSDRSRDRSPSAVLHLEPEHGEIVQISGSDIDAGNDRNGGTVRIEGIYKGHVRRVLIEMKLKAVEESTFNRLKFTMQAIDSLPELPERKNADAGKIFAVAPIRHSFALAWPIESCGNKYHAALQKIGEDGGNDLRKIWRVALTPDKSMSRRWMFSPSIPRRSARSRNASEDSAISKSEARAIYFKTRDAMRLGYDRDLRRNGRYGWIISKTANDLKKYFSQDMNPAICTGASDFVAYYEERLSPLMKREQRLRELVQKAERLAFEKSQNLIETMRNIPGGHPALGGAMLVTLKPIFVAGGDMKSLTLKLLRAADFPQDIISTVARTNSPYDALRNIDKAGLKTGQLPKSLRGELDDTFASIETAIRLRRFHDRYAEFADGFFGSLKAIRSAHSQHCVCGS